MKLVFLLFVLLSVFRQTEACYPLWSIPEHPLCDGGTYILHICTAEDPKDAYFMSTCLGVPVAPTSQMVHQVFLPLTVKNDFP